MKKGSITIYLSLSLCVLMSLILVCIDSARLSSGRAVVSCAADEGLYSLFGEYDRTLYKEYGLLFIDGGYGSGSLNAGRMMDEVKSVMDYTIGTGSLTGSSVGNLYRISAKSSAVTGYILAVDSDYAELKRQISDLMTKKLGAYGISELAQLLSGTAGISSENQNSTESGIDSLKESYENAKSDAAAGEDSTENTPVEVPADFVNPIDNASRVRKLGIFANVVPNLENLSNASLDRSSLQSSRSLNSGMGLLPKSSSSLTDRLLIADYIAEFFPNYRKPGERDGIKYQVEYAIAGKSSDIDNFKSVLNRLFAAREAANFAFLNYSQTYKAQVDEAALIISSALTLPEIAPLVSELLMALWSWNESLNDLKILLTGGKVPLVKSDNSWNLSLEELAVYSSGTIVNKNSSGLEYSDYLKILLALKSEKELIKSTADLLEYNRRIIDSEPEFRIDDLVSAFEIEVDGKIGSHEFCLSRSYGYDANAK